MVSCIIPILLTRATISIFLYFIPIVNHHTFVKSGGVVKTVVSFLIILCLMCSILYLTICNTIESNIMERNGVMFARAIPVGDHVLSSSKFSNDDTLKTKISILQRKISPKNLESKNETSGID